MEVILKEDVDKLGHRGDVVNVADGYGRNYLLPKKLAMEANAANKAVIEQMKASAVRSSAKEKAEAEALVGQLTVYRSSSSARPANTISCLARSPRPILRTSSKRRASTSTAARSISKSRSSQLGEFHIPVKLHREVTAHVAVTVKGDEKSE